MKKSSLRRVRALERTLAGHGGCDVLTYGPHETAADALARASAAGMQGGFLIVPALATVEEWMRTAPKQQADLLRAK